MASIKSELQTPEDYQEDVFDRIPKAYFNAHRYLYTNGVEISEGTKEVPSIYHSDDKFEFDLPVSDDVESTGIQLVAKFSGDVLVTRVGIRGKETYFGRPEVRIVGRRIFQCSFEYRHLSEWEDRMITGPGPRTA